MVKGMMFKVGSKNLMLVGREGIQFDMTDSGALLLVRFNKPSKEEIESFRSKAPFEMRLIELKDTIFLMFKFGTLPWMDSPYTIHLSKGDDLIPEVPDGCGYFLTVVLCDTDGTVKHLRGLSMTTHMSRELRNAIIRQEKKTFTLSQYFQDVQEIYGKYSTMDLCRMASCYMKA